VRGDGTAPILQDSFEYRDGACPPELALSRSSVALTADPGSTASAQVQVDANAGSTAFTASDDASWLSVSPGSGTTPRTLTLTANAAGLAPGTYDATVTATAPGHVSARTTVSLTVAAPYAINMSTASNRSSPVALAGRTVSRVIYPFMVPESGATRVRFWLDNPAATGNPRVTEGNPPWDFVGTANNGTAKPWDTRSIANGSHTITAVADLPGGGTRTVHATFQVAN
jgi:large repetitive protein